MDESPRVATLPQSRRRSLTTLETMDRVMTTAISEVGGAVGACLRWVCRLSLFRGFCTGRNTYVPWKQLLLSLFIFRPSPER